MNKMEWKKKNTVELTTEFSGGGSKKAYCLMSYKKYTKQPFTYSHMEFIHE